MSKTGKRGAASTRPRDTPKARDTPRDRLPFDIILKLQSESFHIQDLGYALSSVIAELTEAPGVSQHPGVSAAETLMNTLTSAHQQHHQTLEDLEMARFGTREREVA